MLFKIIKQFYFLIFFYFYITLGVSASTLILPPKRIITLAPNLTEMVFLVGAEKQLVGVSCGSDFPKASKLLPEIGCIQGLDLEKLKLLKPDLALVWAGGTSANQIAQLKKMQIPLISFSFENLNDIANAIKTIGIITQHQKKANQWIKLFRHTLNLLSKAKNPNKINIKRTAYLFGQNPFYTVGQKSFISSIILFCGGKNVFAEQQASAFEVNDESLVAKNPQIILSSENLIKVFQKPGLNFIDAARNKQIYQIPADWIERPGPRIIFGIKKVCRILNS